MRGSVRLPRHLAWEIPSTGVPPKSSRIQEPQHWGRRLTASTGRPSNNHFSAHPGHDDQAPPPRAPSPQVHVPARHVPRVAVTNPGPHSPVAATPRLTAAHSSSTHSPHSRAGRAMQPLGSERGRAGAAAVSASSLLAPTSRPRRPGGQSRRRREELPRPRPQVTRARGGARARAADGAGHTAPRLPPSDTWPPSAPPPVTATEMSCLGPKATSSEALWQGSSHCLSLLPLL